MTDIRELDQLTVDRIAAGEVVERPAAALKELVENSLDAGASAIDIELEAGGTETLTVRDDGHGMTEADLRAAVRKHTTSKIRELADLETVGTLGFRGEALHAIGAVSRMTITSRAANEHRGARLVLEGGEVEEVTPAGRPVGTTVTVRDLFYNVPARRKYLAAEPTEFAHCNRIASRYALANPDAAVSLTHDGRETFGTPGRGDLQEAALAVWGREVAEALVPIPLDPEDLEESPVRDISGYVSHPETTRSTREYLATYVNGRAVEEAGLRDAILAGYGGQLAADRFPFAAIFVEVSPDAVDANVHPRKLEVRFSDPGQVREAVEGAVRTALLEAGILRRGAPRGRSAPDDVSVSPARSTANNASREQSTPNDAGGDTVHQQQEVTPTVSTGEPDDGNRADTAINHRETGRSSDVLPTEPAPGETEGGERCAVTDASSPATAERKFEPPTENARLTDLGLDIDTISEPTKFETLPPMRVLGQLNDTYVVAATDEGLVLIDQHAADERIHYERLVAVAAEQTDAQRLVDPVELEVTPAEAAIFESALPTLHGLGFEAHLDDDHVVVEAVPGVLASALSPERIRDALAEALADEVGHDAIEESGDALIADFACHPAVTGNTTLTEGSVVELLTALDECENPYACPHGRPTIVSIDSDEIADRFERDYPGHQTRRPE